MARKLSDFPTELATFFGSAEEIEAIGAGRWEYDDGEYIIREGDQDQDLFILETGSIVVEKTNDAGGPPVVIHAALQERGGFIAFGEMAYYAGGIRTASVRSSGRSSVLRLPPVSFPKIFHKSPALAERLFRLLVEHLRQTTDDLKALQSRTLAAGAPVERKAGTVLFEAGTPAQWLYQCISGVVELGKGRKAKQAMADDPQNQGLIDLLPYLRGGVHMQRAVCKTDCLLLEFGPDARLRVLSTFPEAVLREIA